MLNLIHQTFGRLTVVEKTNERQGKSIIWKCICRCGNKNAKIPARDLVHGNRKGCGVCKDTEHPLYAIWRGIISRCEDLTDKNYGGRGIKIFPEWRNEFLSFVEYMPERPSTFYSIDRINVDGNYEPGNVRWATAQEQADNKRDLIIGLTDAQILTIYTSKESIESLAVQFNLTTKTIYNIKSRNYSDRASTICIRYMLNKLKK